MTGKRLPTLLRCWTVGRDLLFWCIGLLVVCVLVWGLRLYHRREFELRRHLEALLAERCPQLAVELGRVRVLKGEGIRIHRVWVHTRREGSSPPRELAYVDEFFLQCNPRWPDLLQGTLVVQHVYLRRTHWRCERDQKGSWNFEGLFAGNLWSKSARPLPPVTFESATFEVVDRYKSPPSTLVLRNVQARLAVNRRDLHAGSAAGVPVSQAPAGLPQREPEFAATAGSVHGDGAVPSEADRELTLEVDFSGDEFRHARVVGTLSLMAGRMDVRATVRGLRVSSRLLRRLPSLRCGKGAGTLYSLFAKAFAATDRGSPHPFEHLEATANLQIELVREAYGRPIRPEVRGQLISGRWIDARVPQPLTDLKADFYCSDREWKISRLSVHYGESDIQLTCVGQGWSAQGPLSLHATLRNFTVDAAMVQLLPDSLHQHWRKYQPLGRIHGTVQLDFDGIRWTHTAQFECLDVSLVHHRFPYPVTRCQGVVDWDSQQMEFRLNGYVGLTPVSLEGRLDHPGTHWTGWCQVRSKKWMNLDEDMLAALSPQVQNVVQQLRLRCRLLFALDVQRDVPSDAPAAPHIQIAVEDGLTNYVKFPYPVQQITGRVELRDGAWYFHELRGSNGGCMIECSGSWTAERNVGLQLSFHVQSLSLDPELYRALSPDRRRLWDQLRPRGVLERASIYLTQALGHSRPKIYLRMEQSAPAEDSDSQVQLFPVSFPYRLQRVAGSAQYGDGHLRIESFSAVHKRTRISGTGTAQIADTGAWQLHLFDVYAESLHIDDDLRAALPKGLARVVTRLAPHGSLAIQSGRFLIDHPAGPEPAAIRWDMRLDVDQFGFDRGPQIDHAFGYIRLEGHYSDQQLRMEGQLALDSVMYQGVQVTDVRGPLRADSTGLIVGSQLSDDGSVSGQPVSGRLHGGTLQLNLRISAQPDLPFWLNASLTGADLASAAREHARIDDPVLGHGEGELELAGTSEGTHTWRGRGAIRIRDANLYQLPLLLALLQRLSSGQPNDAAFSRCDVQFLIRGDHVYFDRFDLEGNAVTLKGEGEMNLNQEIHLDFYSLVGREQLWGPLMRPLVGEASRQFLLIRVDGTLHDPVTTQEILPALNDTLRRLFPELARNVSDTGPGRRPLRTAWNRLRTKIQEPMTND